MTALTVPARLGHDADLRPLPWRRMAWVTWRQHRTALAGVAAFLGAWAVYLWLGGLQLHHAYTAAAACPLTSSRCIQMMSDFYGSYWSTAEVVPAWVQAGGSPRCRRGGTAR